VWTTAIAEAAARSPRSRRYWALVGNGSQPDRRPRDPGQALGALLQVDRLRRDRGQEAHRPVVGTDDPGLRRRPHGSTADDVAKEVAIYRAHKAAPIVIATEGDRSFGAALAVLTVPDTHPRLAFVLATMAGHLFGYEAALAIDAQARPLREARAAIDTAVAGSGGDLHGEHVDGEELLSGLRPALSRQSSAFLDGLRAGAYNGHLEANTAVRLTGQFRYAVGISPLDCVPGRVRQGRHARGRARGPQRRAHLGDRGADPPGRRDQAPGEDGHRRHQPFSDESLLQVALVAAALESGSPRDRLTYATLRSLGQLDPAVVEVTGYTRYRVEHGDDLDRRR
jgi:glucosamine--fructose-6-phosphate aminotransferase (isomerizing)